MLKSILAAIKNLFHPPQSSSPAELNPQPAAGDVSHPAVIAIRQGQDLSLKELLALGAEGTDPFYRKAYVILEIDKGFEHAVSTGASLVQNGMARYQDVCRRIGWAKDDWWIIGSIHYKEASCDFTRCLHNGDKCIGNGKKTLQVPAGRGPFASWEDSAVDAITMHGSRWEKIRQAGGEIGAVGFSVERYNGTGYLTGAGRSEYSPYLFDMTTINDGRGRYTTDGKFDANAAGNKSPGFFAIVKQLDIREAIRVRISS